MRIANIEDLLHLLTNGGLADVATVRPQRRQPARRASTGPLPALERHLRRPPRAGAATPAARITPHPAITTTSPLPRDSQPGSATNENPNVDESDPRGRSRFTDLKESGASDGDRK
jgi:hypothetical protein